MPDEVELDLMHSISLPAGSAAERKGTGGGVDPAGQKKAADATQALKIELSKRVAELERKGREDEKKLETLRHQLESSNKEKETYRIKLDNLQKKVKQEEVESIRSSRLASSMLQPAASSITLGGGYQEEKKSPRGISRDRLLAQKDQRKDRKYMKKAESSMPEGEEPLIRLNSTTGDVFNLGSGFESQRENR